MTVNRALPTRGVAHERSAPARTAGSSPVPRGAARTPRARLLELQRRRGNRAVARLAAGPDATERVRSVVGTGGTPLDTAVRGRAEEFFGTDLSHVRVHTDGAAARSAESVGAEAYTAGAHVVFDAGRYDPSSTDGKRRLAHELAHVVQQRSGPVSGTATGGLSVSDPGDRFERAAEQQAAAFVSGSRAPIRPVLETAVQTATSVPLPVQRTIEIKNIDQKAGANDRKAIEEFFDSHDAKTQEAWRYATTHPGLPGKDNRRTIGYLTHWRDVWNRFVMDDIDRPLYRVFGYVVEALVSYRPEFMPAAPPGYGIVTQVSRGGTRPDFVLMKESREVAWLDLTASNSKGHIKNKANWFHYVDSFGEVSYPSLNRKKLQDMKSGAGTVEVLSPADQDAATEQERLAYKQLSTELRTWGLDFTAANAKLTEAKYHLNDSPSGPRLRMNHIITLLAEHFLPPGSTVELVPDPDEIEMAEDSGAEVSDPGDTEHDDADYEYDDDSMNELMATNVLMAMDVPLMSWGLTSFTGSRSAGEAWLSRHPRRTPQIVQPSEKVKRKWEAREEKQETQRKRKQQERVEAMSGQLPRKKKRKKVP